MGGCGERGRFVIDAMLKNIVSWLRILGCDVIYCGGADSDVLNLASKEGRTIITMDKELALRAARRGLSQILLTENDVAHILATLSERCGISLEFDSKNTRCPLCNHPLMKLEDLGKDEWLCPNCGKRYWRGSHWRNIKQTIDEAKKMVGQRKSSIEVPK